MTNSPTIILVSSEYPPNICGGLGVHIARMVAALREKVRFELFVPRFSSYSTDNSNVRLHEIAVPQAESELELWWQFCSAIALSPQTSSLSAQLIHCHDWMTILAGVSLRQRLELPLVFNVHLPEHIGSRYCLENIGLVAADLVVVNSEAVREELTARNLGIRHIEVVPNGVDSSVFFPSHQWPEEEDYVLFVGRLVAQKGLDILLRSFAAVLRRCPESRLVIAGDGDLELYFKRMVRHFGFPDRVIFVGWQTGEALTRLYQQAQVVVIPSYYEPFGIVALEAMACGRPVIASRVGGLAEIIEDDVQGYLFQAGDHLQLARRLSSLLLDPRRRREMGVLARERALQFSWSSAADRIMDLYASLIGRSVEAASPSRILEVSRGLPAGLAGQLDQLGLSFLPAG